MKITSPTAALQDAFQIVGAVVPARPTRPILSNVLMKASGGGLEIMATDREVGIRLLVGDVNVEAEGEAAVPQARVNSILHETRDETVALEANEGHCQITASDSEFRLPTESAEEFPEMADFDEENAYEFDRADFEEMVSKTTFAAHKGKHRYALNGVLLVLDGDKVRMVATDGRRLAHIERKARQKVEEEISVIVPTKALEQIIRVLTDEEESLSLNIGETQIVARTQRGLVSALLVEGHFPPYDTVIPKDCDKKVDINRERFQSAVRRAALVTSEESSSVTVRLAPQKMTVSSAAPETGEAKVELPVEYDGAELEIGFSPEFLTEFLRALTDESVRMEFRDGSSAGLFRAGKDFLYVVMPVSRE
jgi:DNA polymerase-3 subunit beta